MSAIISAMKDVILDGVKTDHDRHVLIRSVTQKAISVLLADALSNTVYQTCLMLRGEDHQLESRAIYAIGMSVYGPFAAWFFTNKCRCARGESLLAVSLQLHVSICPVLIAWGWKDFANSVDERAGAHILPDAILACIMTVLIIGLQSLSCFDRHRQTIANGTGNASLIARYATLPSCLGLTCGYCWNLVAHHPVVKIRKLNPGYDFAFTVQAGYALIVGVFATVVTIFARVDPHPNTHKHSHTTAFHSKQTDNQQLAHIIHSMEQQVHPFLKRNRIHITGNWTGLLRSSSLQCTVQILSFVYAWAFSDTVEDFAFGIMFACPSFDTCSQQANFLYAMVLTCFFIPAIVILQKTQEYREREVISSTVVCSQMNAMILAVGWAWKGWYFTYMEYLQKHVVKHDGVMITVYIHTFIVILVFTNLVNFVLHKTDTAWDLHHEYVLKHFEESAAASEDAIKQIQKALQKDDAEPELKRILSPYITEILPTIAKANTTLPTLLGKFGKPSNADKASFAMNRKSSGLQMPVDQKIQLSIAEPTQLHHRDISKHDLESALVPGFGFEQHRECKPTEGIKQFLENADMKMQQYEETSKDPDIATAQSTEEAPENITRDVLDDGIDRASASFYTVLPLPR